MPELRLFTPEEQAQADWLTQNETQLTQVIERSYASPGNNQLFQQKEELFLQREKYLNNLTPEYINQFVAKQLISTFRTPQELVDWIDIERCRFPFDNHYDDHGYTLALIALTERTQQNSA